MRFQIQGYAAVWNEEPLDDTRGYGAMAPGSINIANGRNIELRLGLHNSIIPYARTRDHTLSFWNDDRGLCFSAWIDGDIRGALAMHNAIARGDISGASWGAASFADLQLGGEDGRRILHARIEEVTLCADPNYAGTGCWLADQPIKQRAPWVRGMSIQYGKSVLARGLAGSPAKTTGVPARLERTARGGSDLHGAAPRLPPNVLAFLNSSEFSAGHRMHSEASRALMLMRQPTRNCASWEHR